MTKPVTKPVTDGKFPQQLRVHENVPSVTSCLGQKTDSAGNVLGTNDVSPYGELFSSTATDRLLFTQHERDAENGSDSALYRQYASTQGRWLSPDPYNGSYNLADPQSLNRYTYVSGRPLAAVDNLGLEDGGQAAAAWGAVLGIIELFRLFAGGGHHTGPPNTADTGYGVPNGTNGNVVYPPYVSQQSSDPGSLGESLGIPLSIPHGVWGIGPALGLPSVSCEFGACGGGPSTVTQGNAAISVLALPSIGFYRLLSLLRFPYHDVSDPNRRLFGTHYCGPGGGGSVGPGLDQLCAAHDLCYKGHGMTGIDTINPFGSGAAMGGCDRLLCAGLQAYQPKSSEEQLGKGQIQQIFGCSYISTE